MSATDPINKEENNQNKEFEKEKNLQFINQHIIHKVFDSIKDIINDPELLIKEYQNVKTKISNKSRSQRDLIVKYVEQWLPILDKMINEEKNEQKEDKEDSEKAEIVK